MGQSNDSINATQAYRCGAYSFAHALQCILPHEHEGHHEYPTGLRNETPAPWADPNGPDFVRFSQADINAAVLVERERCARIADEYDCVGRSCDGGGIADQIRQKP